jgi:hypothetical protein
MGGRVHVHGKNIEVSKPMGSSGQIHLFDGSGCPGMLPATPGFLNLNDKKLFRRLSARPISEFLSKY